MNALVVGKGRMGSFHAKVLRDLGYTVRTVDPDPSKDAHYPTIADARLDLNGPWWQPTHKIDVACIATPAEYLVDSAYQLAGITMLVEKPFALTSRSAWMLAAYLKQAGAPVCVGYVERFNPVVREIRHEILNSFSLEHVTFSRWSDRPSWNHRLDLTAHDVDLASYLGLACEVKYDTMTAYPSKLRHVVLRHKGGRESHYNLMDHDLSPLHALWHAFLTGKPVPTPEEAARVLEVIESMNQSPIEEAA